jgi:xanthine/uracil permease
VRTQGPRSGASSIVSFALAVLLACWAVNWAARLLMAVWPVLVGTIACLALARAVIRFYWQRDRW